MLHVNKNLTMPQFNSSTPAKVPLCTKTPTDIEVDWIATMIQGNIEFYLARDHASSPVPSQIEM
jgi:hypothetical protein